MKKTLLIANRGEIAVRLAATARDQGMQLSPCTQRMTQPAPTFVKVTHRSSYLALAPPLISTPSRHSGSS